MITQQEKCVTFKDNISPISFFTSGQKSIVTYIATVLLQLHNLPSGSLGPIEFLYLHTGVKIHIGSKKLLVQNHIFQKIHIFQEIHIFKIVFFSIIHLFKITFLTKIAFTKYHFSQKLHFRSPFSPRIAFSEAHFSQKPHFQTVILRKNHISKSHISQKSQYFKHQNQVNLWPKNATFVQSSQVTNPLVTSEDYTNIPLCSFLSTK